MSFSFSPSSSTPTDYRIQTATLADLSALVDVLMDSFYPPNRFNRWLYPIMRVGINEDLKLRLKVHSQRYYCLAAIALDGTLVGTAEVSLRSPLPFFPQRAYVSNLAVSRYHRRRGVAQQLLQSCEILTQNWGRQQLYLHVAQDNPAAQGLYDKLNYRPTSSRLEYLMGRLGLTHNKQLRAKPLSEDVSLHPAERTSSPVETGSLMG